MLVQLSFWTSGRWRECDRCRGAAVTGAVRHVAEARDDGVVPCRARAAAGAGDQRRRGRPRDARRAYAAVRAAWAAAKTSGPSDDKHLRGVAVALSDAQPALERTVDAGQLALAPYVVLKVLAD